MKKMILVAIISLCTMSASAQTFTLKELVSKATSTEGIQKVKDFFAMPEVMKVMDELNPDLNFNFQEGKAVMKSNSDFSYIKVNGQQLPKQASIKLEAFGIGVSITKKSGAFVVQKL